MSVFKEEIVIVGADDQPISCDVSFNPNLRDMPLVIFCHGFKGFKDWGPWNAVAAYFAERGVFFLKINFSHNGVSLDDLSEITDIETFGKNTITKELTDLTLVLDWFVEGNEIYRPYIDVSNVTLIGHSLGAAICLIKTIEDDRILRIISWGGAFNLKKLSELEDDKAWKERGYSELTNDRTGDVYQINYSFREDFLSNIDQLDLTKRLVELDQGILMIHGTNDLVSPISNAKKIFEFVPHALLIENEGNHTFGGKHPWEQTTMPPILEQVVVDSLEFIQL